MTLVEVVLGRPPQPTAPWVLLVGGVTREGNRRARRACREAVDAGFDVVWFDGFDERDAHSGERVPLELDGSDRVVFVVPYSEIEQQSLAGKLVSSHWLRKTPLTRWIWRKVTRRLGLVLRPRAGWKAIRPLVTHLKDTQPPSQIVYSDEYSLTSAWRCARLWPAIPTSMTFIRDAV